MKYFKDTNGNVYAYESDGSQDAYIRPDLVAMTDEEVTTHLNPPPPEPLPPTRQELLDAITVTTQSGKVFDGDEVSQTRIARALQIAVYSSQTETNWKLRDNTVELVTIDELQEALALAMTEVGKIVGAI